MSTYSDWIAARRSQTDKLVRTERDGLIATVTLADPDRLNCLSPALMVQLRSALDELDSDPAVRAVVITGEGRGRLAPEATST